MYRRSHIKTDWKGKIAKRAGLIHRNKCRGATKIERHRNVTHIQQLRIWRDISATQVPPQE